MSAGRKTISSPVSSSCTCTQLPTTRSWVTPFSVAPSSVMDGYDPTNDLRGPARQAFIRVTCPAVNMNIAASSV